MSPGSKDDGLLTTHEPVGKFTKSSPPVAPQPPDLEIPRWRDPVHKHGAGERITLRKKLPGGRRVAHESTATSEADEHRAAPKASPAVAPQPSAEKIVRPR